MIDSSSSGKARGKEAIGDFSFQDVDKTHDSASTHCTWSWYSVSTRFHLFFFALSGVAKACTHIGAMG